MKYINELRNNLIEAFEMVKTDPRKVHQGKNLVILLEKSFTA